MDQTSLVGVGTEIFYNLCEAYLSNQYNCYVLEGGSRSSKTWSIIQFWFRWSWARRNIKGSRRVAVCRLKATWLKATVMKDFIDFLQFFEVYDERKHDKTSKIYNLFGTEFWFVGLDDSQKIHGMATDAFWINEAIEAKKEDYDQLMQRCSGFAILDYNPSEYEHWIYNNVKSRPKTWYNHSTMLLNPLIPANAREQILSYEPTDYNYEKGTVDKRKWQIYGLGLPAKLEGVIFDPDKWKIIPDQRFPIDAQDFQGLDFGFSNHPTALEDVSFNLARNGLYIREQCYETKMMGDDIIKVLKKCNYDEHKRKKKIWADSADPRLIEEIHNAGFNIHSVDKFHVKGSVNAGIQKMQEMNIFITESSFHIIKEFKNYTWAQDKNGVWLNEPVKNFDHAIDGTRYVVLEEILGHNKPKKNLRKTLSSVQ